MAIVETGNLVKSDLRRDDLAKLLNNEVTIASVQLVDIAIGDGGVDSDGNPIPVDPTDTALNNETLRKTAVFVGRTDNQLEFTITLGLTEHNGLDINELGAFAQNGNMIGKLTFSTKVKNNSQVFTFKITETF